MHNWNIGRKWVKFSERVAHMQITFSKVCVKNKLYLSKINLSKGTLTEFLTKFTNHLIFQHIKGIS